MAQSLAAGFQLGQYVIVRLVGKGGMAEVYEANEPLLQRRVALKIIAAEDLDGPTAINLFYSEGKTLAQINHPNVVTIFQLGVDQGIHYIAMEFVEGPSLEVLLQKQKFDHEYAMMIFGKVLTGVQALHRKGIVHRDLKPNNIIVTSDKKVKIVDFGIAEIITTTQKPAKTGLVIGSIPFMPPEVADGNPATFQSDIWSLGVILFCLLTGKRPFTGSGPTEILNNIKNQNISLPILKSVHLSTQANAVIQRMCNRSLEKRYSSVDEIINELSKPPTQADEEARNNNLNMKWIKWGISASLSLAVGIMLFKISSVFKEKNVKAPITQDVPADSNPAKISSAMPVARPPVAELSPLIETSNPEALKLAEEIDQQVQNDPEVRVETSPKKNMSEQHKKPLAKVQLKSALSEFELDFKSNDDPRSPSSLQSAAEKLPLLMWTSSAGAEAYQIQIAKDSHFIHILLSKNISEPYFRWTRASTGHFFWRVRAAGHGHLSSEFSQVGQLIVKVAPPKTLRTQYSFQISGKAKDNNEQMVEWTSTRLVDAYKVSISTDSNMTKSVFSKIVKEPKIKLKMTSGTYYLSVVALGTDRRPASEASKSVQIEVKSAIKLIPPVLEQPSNEITVPNQGTMITPIACKWRADDSTSEFEFQLSADPHFGRITHEARIHERQYLVTIPLPKGKFYWRVRSILKDNTSAWSKPYIFVIE